MSDLNPLFVSGWISDPERVAEVIRERHERGDAVTSTAFTAARR